MRGTGNRPPFFVLERRGGCALGRLQSRTDYPARTGALGVRQHAPWTSEFASPTRAESGAERVAGSVVNGSRPA